MNRQEDEFENQEEETTNEENGGENTESAEVETIHYTPEEKTIMFIPKGCKKDPWYGKRGNVRVVIYKLWKDKRRLMNLIDEIHKDYLESIRKIREDMIEEIMILITKYKEWGYEVRTGDGYTILESEQEIKINKTIGKVMLRKLPEWARMEIKAKIGIMITNDTICNIRIQTEDGRNLALYHSNENGTCWGSQRGIIGKKVTEEEVKEAIKGYKELMEVVNYRSPYQSESSICDLITYLKYGERLENEDLEEATREEMKKKMEEAKERFISKENERNEKGIRTTTTKKEEKTIIMEVEK